MGKRNPTWAEVTEQNLKRLDPFARFADIPMVEDFEAGEIEEILDGLISMTAPVEKTRIGESSCRETGRIKAPPTRNEADAKKAAAQKKAPQANGEFQVVKRKGDKPFKDPKSRPPQFVDNRFGVLKPEESEEEEEGEWMMEEHQETEAEEDEEILPEAENGPVNHDHNGSQLTVPERSIDIGGGNNQGNVGLPSGNGRNPNPSENQMDSDRNEHYTNFEDAERANARPASLLDQDSSTRLSCINGDRLLCAEGRKKPRGVGEQADESKEAARIGPSVSTGNAKKDSKNAAGRAPGKGK
ncbi:hypothetical protein R1sor_022866 [Riccia sorocarpa]|uniref:Uncharacterized protein n=1 Tax=Riccia sorocarpa TaxID=122646 RepID=A0ABD3GP94_9MARC